MSKTIDLRNVQNEDNLSPAYGVFTTNALLLVAKLAKKDLLAKQLLIAMLGEFLPDLGQVGTPVGKSPLDAIILAEGFDPAKATSQASSRYKSLKLVVELLGRMLGALTAHEIGHSLGLVADGPPPWGHFGGEKNASFVSTDRTTPYHIDTAGFNIMEAGPGSAPTAPLNFAHYMTTPRFKEINRAYLQGRLLLLPK